MLDTRELAREFDQLWDAYPRPTSRPKAHLAYLIARKGGATLEQMLAALDWQRQQPSWLRDEGTYVPSLTNWLKDERWLDRRPTQGQVSEKTARTLAAVAKFAGREIA